MALVKVNIKGKEYPCRMTMGAILRYKRETGEDIGQLKTNDLASLITLFWCCVASACKADGVDFEMNCEEFADNLDSELVNSFIQTINESGDGKKKVTAR